MRRGARRGERFARRQTGPVGPARYKVSERQLRVLLELRGGAPGTRWGIHESSRAGLVHRGLIQAVRGEDPGRPRRIDRYELTALGERAVETYPEDPNLVTAWPSVERLLPESMPAPVTGPEPELEP